MFGMGVKLSFLRKKNETTDIWEESAAEYLDPREGKKERAGQNYIIRNFVI
jgi:hypothetical protein